MIKLEIIDTPDADFEFTYQFHKNLIYLGNHPSCDIFIHDSKVMNNHLFVEIIGKKLVMHLNPKIKYCHVNNKRTGAISYLKIGDDVLIGDTLLKVLEFSEEQVTSYKDFLNQRTEEILKKNDHITSLVKEFLNHES